MTPFWAHDTPALQGRSRHWPGATVEATVWGDAALVGTRRLPCPPAVSAQHGGSLAHRIARSRRVNQPGSSGAYGVRGERPPTRALSAAGGPYEGRSAPPGDASSTFSTCWQAGSTSTGSSGWCSSRSSRMVRIWMPRTGLRYSRPTRNISAASASTTYPTIATGHMRPTRPTTITTTATKQRSRVSAARPVILSNTSHP